MFGSLSISRSTSAIARRRAPARASDESGSEQSVVGADLRDALELRSAVAHENEPVRAGVGAVEHPEAVRRGLDVEHRPDLAVDDRERRESLHHLRVGLVDEPPGQLTLLVDVEVPALQQERHLERRPLGKAQFALTILTHDPEAREPRVDVQLGDAMTCPESTARTRRRRRSPRARRCR
jgi:hypothetical protein